MKFRVHPKIFERFPGLNIGAVSVKQINNAGSSDEIMCLIREKEEEIRRKYDIETLSRQPKIESWRKAYSLFGAKPKKYKSSVESLYRMILKGMGIRDINKIVNIYNYISIKHRVPAGGDDCAKVDGSISLKFASGHEAFTALHTKEREIVKEGEVVYMDDQEVLCRRWNWRECDKTKMTESTTDVILVVEGLPPVLHDEIEEIEKDLNQLICKYCGGKIKTAVLNEHKYEIDT